MWRMRKKPANSELLCHPDLGRVTVGLPGILPALMEIKITSGTGMHSNAGSRRELPHCRCR